MIEPEWTACLADAVYVEDECETCDDGVASVRVGDVVVEIPCPDCPLGDLT